MSAMRDDSENQLNEVERVLDQAAIAYPREEATQAERVVSLIQQRDDLLAACEGLEKEIEWLIKVGDLPKTAMEHPVMVQARAAIAKAQGARWDDEILS